MARDDMKLLIVGAGVAGTALAAQLTRRGLSTAMVERERASGARGYMLGLLPIGGDVLRGLGLFDRDCAMSQAMRRYQLYDRHGRLAKSVSLARIATRPGSYRGIERGVLLDLLRAAAGLSNVTWGVGLATLEEHRDRVDVGFDDGTSGAFDLVIGADGMESTTRRLVFGDAAASTFRTGWGGWVVWAPELHADDGCYREQWGAGAFVGLYPVAGRLGIFVGGPMRDLRHRTAADVAAYVRRDLLDGPLRRALASADFSGQPYFWAMDDRRSQRWHSDRVVLLGDAATGFLPTAGVGASMAMKSAGLLAEALAAAHPDRLGQALAGYEARQRHRVEHAQETSRSLARLMFLDGSVAVMLRDQAMRLYPNAWLVDDIARIITR